MAHEPAPIAPQQPVAPYIPDTSHDSQIAEHLITAVNRGITRRHLRLPARLSFLASFAAAVPTTINYVMTHGVDAKTAGVAIGGGALYGLSVVVRNRLLHSEHHHAKEAVKEAKETKDRPSELAAFTRLAKESDEKTSRGALQAILAGGVVAEGTALAHGAAVAAGYHSAAEVVAHGAAVKLGILKAGAAGKAAVIGLGAGKAAVVKVGLLKGAALKAGIVLGHAMPWVFGAYILKKGVLDPSNERAVAQKAALALAEEKYAKDHPSKARRRS